MRNWTLWLKQAGTSRVGRLLGVYVGYWTLLFFGELTTGEATKAPLVAPAVAGVVAVLIVSARQNWWQYLCVTGAAEIIYCLNYYQASWAVALVFAAANIAEALLAASLWRRFSSSRIDISEGHGTTTFLFAVGMAGPLVGGVIGGGIIATEYHADFWLEMRRWWYSDAISQLVLTPLFVRALSGDKITFDRNSFLWFLGITILSVVLLLGSAAPGEGAIASWVTPEAVFVLLPLIVWLASRTGLLWVTFSTAVSTLTTIYVYSISEGTELGANPIFLVHLQLLLLSLSATAIITGGLFEEKRRLLVSLEKRRSAEQKTAQASKLQALGLLTGGIAHDFNNLLGIIGLRISLTKKALPSSGAHVLHLERASEAIKKGSDLIKRLLAFSREKPQSVAIIDLKSSVADTIELLQKSKDSPVSISYSHCIREVFCSISPSEFESAVVNLVLNARDAIDGVGTIDVRVDTRVIAESGAIESGGKSLAPGKYAAVTVRDSGRGMTAAEISQCFEPFFTTKEVGAGTGLGLTMVNAFAQRSGGSILVESAVGKGTTFTILIPCASAPESRLEPALVPVSVTCSPETPPILG